MASARANDTLHREFFGPMQEQIHLATAAISEARQLAYAALRTDVEPETLRAVAAHWLDRFGRDPLSDALLASEPTRDEERTG